MATLNIGGQKVKVGDEFLSLTPEQQQAAVEEIMQSLGGASQPAPADVQQPAPQPEQAPRGDASQWGMLPQAMDMLTMGGAMKMNAAAGGLIDAVGGAVQGEGWNWSDNYNRQLQEQRDNQAAYSDQNPVRSGVGTGAGLALAVARLPMIGAGLKGAAQTGAAYGGAGGLLQDADSLVERGQNTLLGTGTGGLIGTGGYYGGQLLGAAAKKAGKVISAIRAPADVKAASQIYEAAENVGLPEFQRRLAELGSDAINADVLGKRGTALSRGAANISPEAREILESTVQARKAGQNTRLASDVEKAAGLPAGNTKNTEALKKAAYDKVRPEINRAYDAAREAGADVDLEYFADLLDTPMGNSAFNKAFDNVVNRMAVKGEKAGGNLAVMDEMKKVLDSMAKSAARSGDDATADVAQSMAKQLRYQMDVLLDGAEYSTARGLRQKAYQADEAFDLGEQLGGSRVLLGVPEQASRVSPDLQPNVAQAYGAKKVESLLNRGSTEGALNEFLTPQGRKAAQAALGPNDALLGKALDRERAFNVTNRELVGNSTTARQLAEMAGTGVGTTGVGLLMGYDPTTSGIAGGLAALGRRAVPTITKRMVTENQKAVAPYIAKLLTQQGLPLNRPIPPGFLERFATAGDAKTAKAMMLIWNNEIQKTNRQTVPAR
jgi:hypothetical protein